ncbi:potassium/proton antiporter [Dongia sp.]|uniref:potassium/proton antiporter n=1 Tax=Dongia sp. TaxID=1977262 RepID=UPI0035B205B3
MTFINQLIFLGALLALISILLGQISSRLGAPLLLVFLVLGMLAGEDGVLGLHFESYETTFAVGSIALAIILFEGGLRTPRDVVRLVFWPSLSLATVGVLLTALCMAGMAVLVMGMQPLEGILMGAILASTDAAAVFMLLHGQGVAVNARVGGTLELESGMNDPMAVFLTLMAVHVLQAGAQVSGWYVLGSFGLELVGGGLIGAAGGFALRWLLQRLTLSAGLYPVLATAGALLIFGGTNALHASGFLAVYVAGVMLAQAPYRAQQVITRFLDGLAWLAQIAMFLMLGLLVTPSDLLKDLAAALVLALGLILVARPGAVMLCLLPFRFNWRERGFVAWVGLRGAVPIFLASIPILAGVPDAQIYFNVAFVAVLTSLMVQGWTVGRAARFLGLEVPAAAHHGQELDISLGHGASRELAGYRVQDGARVLKHDYGAIDLPDRADIISVIRDSSPIALFRETRPLSGDYVIALAPPAEIAGLHQYFAYHEPDAPAAPAGFGEFVFEADTPASDLALIYGLPIGPVAKDLSLGAFLHERLGEQVVAGDRLKLGEIELVVRKARDGRIVRVGLELEDTRVHLPVTRTLRKLKHPMKTWRAFRRLSGL